MKAMIFAAGIGSRLKPFTDLKPKALLPVGDKTLLQISIERLKHFGIHEIIINVHHFSHQVISYLTAHNNFDVNIQISDESSELLDTGGGLKKAAHLFSGNDPILLQNVDIYSNINYSKLVGHHLATKAMATLAVQKRDSSRYLTFNDQMQLCGWENIVTHKQIIIRNESITQKLAFSGIHIISPEVLNYMPEKNVFGIIEVYLELSRNQTISGYLHNDDYWFDVGTPQKHEKLERFLGF